MAHGSPFEGASSAAAWQECVFKKAQLQADPELSSRSMTVNVKTVIRFHEHMCALKNAAASRDPPFTESASNATGTRNCTISSKCSIFTDLTLPLQ